MPSESDHVGPIIFANETAREQLVEHGEVITFRTDSRTTGETWWRESRTGPKQGDVLVEWVKDVCPHGTGMALEPYLELSGFDSVHEWQQAIRAENGGMPAEGELYRVTLLDESHRTCAACDGTIVTEDCILTETDGSQLRVCADCGAHGVRWFTFGDGDDVVAGPVYDAATPGGRLRTAADLIRAAAETAPEGDFDEETLAEYEAEFGEVASIQAILTDLEQTTRTLGILADAHAEANDA